MRWEIYNGKKYFPELKGATWMVQGSKLDKNGRLRPVTVRKFTTKAKATAFVNKMRKKR